MIIKDSSFIRPLDGLKKYFEFNNDSLFRKDSPTERSMALLVEIYLQYIATLPSPLVEALREPEVDKK